MNALDYLLKVEPNLLRVGMAVERAAKVAAPIFEANGWKWARAEFGVPVEYEIGEELARLANSLYRSNAEFTGCGRLSAARFQLDGSDELRFFLDLAQEDVAKVPEDWYDPRDLPRSALELLIDGAREYCRSIQSGEHDTACVYAPFKDALAAIDKARGVYVTGHGITVPVVSSHSPARHRVSAFGYRTCGDEAEENCSGPRPRD